jgi:hypothetical protein
MTEAEWLACDYPGAMIEHLQKGWGTSLLAFAHRLGVLSQPARERRLRLFACHSMRRVWGGLTDKQRHAVEVAERYADGLASAADLLQASVGDYNIAQLVEPALSKAALAADRSADEAARIVGTSNLDDPRRHAMFKSLASVMRDIVGNPFRSLTLSPTLRTAQIGSLALAAYEERELPSGELDPLRLAVLSDALEEAGCTDDPVLSHLRSPGPHVRGCHVIDLCLGLT